jgi:hypothetical protein
MAAVAPSLLNPAEAEPVATGVRRGWIESPRYDLPLLSLAPLLGLLVCAAYGLGLSAITISAVSLFGLGMPHYFSTYAFAFDDANAAYYRSRWMAFFAGPLLIVAGLTVSLYLHFYWFVAAVVDVWNVFHVSRQSAGILSVYRHLAGGDNRREKVPANLAVIGFSAGLYALFAIDQPSFHVFLHPYPLVERYMGIVLLVVGFMGLATLAWRMGRRKGGASVPEVVFLLSSLALFLPYVVVESRSTASSAMLSGHYVQYMSLLWLLNHRKYAGGEEGSPRQRLLVQASRSRKSILLVLVGIVVVSTVIDRFVHLVNANAFHTWALNVVVLMHFYLDGLFWSFKRREVRESIAPHLLQPHRRLLAA